MSDNWIVIIIQVVIGLGIVMLFAPGRKLLWGVISAALGILSKLLVLVGNWLQAAGVHVYKSHVVVLRNLRPRVTVLPTVARKSTRRD